MAEQNNVNVIQKIYAAFNTADLPTILNNVTPNAEWVNHGPAAVPYAGNFTGRISSFFQAIADSTSGGRVTSEKFIAQGDVVVSIGRYIATVQKTGAKIDSPIAHIFTVHDGKVTSWVGFSDSAAVAAAHTGATASAHH